MHALLSKVSNLLLCSRPLSTPLRCHAKVSDKSLVSIAHVHSPVKFLSSEPRCFSRYKHTVFARNTTKSAKIPDNFFSTTAHTSARTFSTQSNACNFFPPNLKEYDTTIQSFVFLGKEITSLMDEYNQLMNVTVLESPSHLRDCAQRMIDQLSGIIKNIETLRVSAPPSIAGSQISYMPNIQGACKNNITVLQSLITHADQLENHLTLRQVFELNRLHYPLSTPLAFHFINHKFEQEGYELGGDKVPVLKLKNITKPNDNPKIYKSHLPFDHHPFVKIAGKEAYFDLRKPKFAGRNFATKAMDDLLNTGLISDMSLAIFRNKLGIIRDMVGGLQPMDDQTFEYTDVGINNPEKPETAAVLHRNLSNSEWIDGSCGQQDRHGSNFFIDPITGKVTLIDNDYCFYPGLTQVRVQSKQPKLRRYSGSTAGLPVLIDRVLFNRLTSLTPETISEALKGLITMEEIDATIQRVSQLQNHAHELSTKGRVVNNWVSWRDPQTGLSVAEFQNNYAPDGYIVRLQGKASPL